MLFDMRDGVTENICEAQKEFLASDPGTKDRKSINKSNQLKHLSYFSQTVFNAGALIQNSIAGSAKYSFSKFDECLRFNMEDTKHGFMEGKYCVFGYNTTESPKLKYTGVLKWPASTKSFLIFPYSPSQAFAFPTRAPMQRSCILRMIF
jgi:hypothetical protein